MAALHSALQALGPCKFDAVPKSSSELESYLQDLFKQARLILESIPIPPPDEKLQSRPRSHTTSSIASNASEISSSSARSAPPIPEYAALQKEWGKQIKFSAKDNPLSMAVYKMNGKDGRGAWFARRSVQEGLGFAKFKKSLEMEFPESLAVQGAPGEGNVRGIGGDKRVEDISVPGKGRVEVFQLSAQFPGPTTPRDFVTLLITSSNAMMYSDDRGRPDLSPRHYMIISKPCDHPETQPRDGFVRGNYESVEFIREVPQQFKKTMSSMDLTKLGASKRSGLEKEVVLRSAERTKANTLLMHHENKSTGDLSATAHLKEQANRRRGKTISFSESTANDLRADGDETDEKYDPESNPVEWIMVTRSDPGGSVPRFMVERGTPGSIVADAAKFLDWACQNNDVEDSRSDASVDLGHRRESFPSYEANGRLAGLDGDSSKEVASDERLSTRPLISQSANQSGFFSNMTGAFSAGLEAYAPQVVLDRLPGHISQDSEAAMAGSSITLALGTDNDDDSTDSLSTASFASADSHLDNELDELNLSSSTSKTSSQKDNTMDKEKKKDGGTKTQISQHEKELQKLDARRAALDAKLASTRSKAAQSQENQTTKEKEAIRKAEEKHAKDMAKQEDKYRKEIEKLERRRKREERKVEDKRRKEEERDEKTRVEKERDETREEVKKLKGEREDWRMQVGELQRENTGLVARIGRLEKEVERLKGGSLESINPTISIADSYGSGSAAGKSKTREKAPAAEKETLLQPIVVDKDVAKSLLKEDKGHRGRIRGVSFGSRSASPSSAESTRSRGSNLLKRATTLGMGGNPNGNPNGNGDGGQGHEKGASS
jgi:Protein of unknown function (DUF3074)